MKIFLNKNKLIKVTIKEKNLGFVPTMGSIHVGHLSLIKKSITQCKKTIVSIFINRPQFDSKNDFNEYPRTLKNDISKIKKLNVDYLYLPSNKQIYPNGKSANVKISPFRKKLCGKYRPGHFEAVVNVIERFIKIIKPRKIYLGKKDFQQLKIIEHYVNKNYPEVHIVPCKTIREKNGIACSSRNILLNSKEKKIASMIYKLITREKKNIIRNKISIKKINAIIIKLGANKVDYIKILDINKTTKPYKKIIKYKIFIAYYLGSTRLIDNF